MSSIRIDWHLGARRGGIGISTYDGLKFFRFKIMNRSASAHRVGGKKWSYSFQVGPFWGYVETYPRLVSERRRAKEQHGGPLISLITEFIRSR